MGGFLTKLSNNDSPLFAGMANLISDLSLLNLAINQYFIEKSFAANIIIKKPL